MKVISGILKGRKIDGYTIDGTRPTMDRVKESVFGTIQNNLKESLVLDLFAGSGQLGIEAISNGAKKCYFIDNSTDAIKTINNNIINLSITDKSVVLLSDWKKALNDFGKRLLKFDIIFIDPPYKYDVYEKIINKVIELDLLNKDGYLVLEHSIINLNDTYSDISLYKEKQFGSKFISIYKKNM